MNVLINFLRRITESPKTTAGGVIAGGGLAAAASLILTESGCQFSQVQWLEVLGLIFAGPTVVGGLSTDEGKTVAKPVS